MKYIINIEEKVTKNKIIPKEYCNIVSKKEGTISKIVSSKGVSLVEVNEHVNAGDILISGTIEYNNEIKSIVCAEGQVYANTWYTINISIPKYHKIKTKKEKYRYNIEIKHNNKTTKIFKSRINNPIKESKHLFNIFNYKIYIIKEYEAENIDIEYTEKEIDNKIDELTKEKLKPILKNNNKIIKQNVLKKTEFNSTIDIELFIVAEEEISAQNYK